MSSQNAFPRPNGLRPAARPANSEQTQQPSWVNPQTQPGYAPQPENSWPPNDSFQSGYGGEPGYGQAQPQQSDYGQWGELQSGHRNEPAPPGPADPYAPQFEPYVPPSHNAAFGRRAQAPAYGQGQQQPAPQWPAHGGADPGDLDAGGYGDQRFQSQGQRAHAAPEFGEQPYRGSELSAADWAGQPSDFGQDPYQQGDNLGFAQAEGGELDQVYDDEEVEYEDEEPTRSRRPVIIMAALAGAILVGGTMAYGYKKLTSTGPHGDPPIIKSEAFPARTKPADAGGKVFPYTDTKIMGRLGDGSSSAPANGSASSLPPAAPDASQTASAETESDDDGGPRKVSTLVVGRDGSIQAPPESGPPSSQVAAVPGTSLVDVFGQNSQAAARQRPSRDEPQAQPSKSVSGDDTPAPVKKAAPVKVTTLNSTSKPSTSSTDDDGGSAVPSRKPPKRVARAESGTASDAYDPGSGSVASSGGTGYVAVLASIPHSSSSRINALKRYADMQQKYSSALSGKTPDIAAANLGAKGQYDRLIVGPPGSRQEASSVCAELKAQGYSSCWVTSY